MTGEEIAIAAALTFPLSNAMFKKVDRILTPTQINAIRTTFGALTFFTLFLIFGLYEYLDAIPFDIIFILILSIVFGQIIGDTAYFQAQKFLGTTIALTISMTFPFFTFFIYILAGRYIPPEFSLSGFLIGVGIIFISKSQLSVSNTNEKTDYGPMLPALLMGVVAAITWAIGIVLTELSFESLSENISNDFFTLILGNMIRFPFAALVLVIFSFWGKKESKSWQKIATKENSFWIVTASLIGTSIGVLLYTEAIRQAGAPITSLILTATPLISMPISWIINKEKVTKIELLGMILTIIGIGLIL
jgi:drug/metabolite transporter (DMT)-like permease